MGRWIVVLVSLLSSGSWLHAGGFTLRAPSLEAGPGSFVVVPIELDTSAGVNGAQFGLAYDPSFLDLDTIDQSGVVAAANGGAGADFFFSEVDPDGQAGGTVGFLLSLSTPFQLVGPGAGLEVVTMTFATAPLVTPGSIVPLDFSDGLGDPVIDIVFAVGTTAVTPALESGEIIFRPPPVTALSCTLVDSCTQSYQISWTNPNPYDAIALTIDGAPLTTISGFSSSATVALGGSGLQQLCVRGRIGTLWSDPTCCTIDVVAPIPSPPAALACIVDADTCAVDVSWSNPAIYTGIEVYEDDVLVATLAGDASGYTTTASETPIELCLIGLATCGATDSACCTVTCGVTFIRGDCNTDTIFDIADAIHGLGVLFSGTPAGSCVDACDVNDDGVFDIADMVSALSALFSGGESPVTPFPDCGIDPTDDPLSCISACL